METKKKYKNEKRRIGQLSSLYFDISDPIKFEKLEIEFNKLSIFVGANGTGKTFLLINAFIGSYLCSGLIKGLPDNSKEIEFAQYLYDKCFDDQNINGKINFKFSTEDEINLEFDKGKIISLTYSEDLKEVENILPVKFMSSPMRTFNAISMYLKIRSTHKTLPLAQVIQKMTEDFKFYDVSYVETLLLGMPKTLTKEMIETLKNSFNFKENIISINVDFEKKDFYTEDDKGIKKYCTTYSAGEQAILNMLIGSSI